MKMGITAAVGQTFFSFNHSGNSFDLFWFSDSADGTKQQNEQSDAKEETCEEHEHTIYKGILSAQIKLVKSFSLMTSVIGLSCQPFLLYQIQVNVLLH